MPTYVYKCETCGSQFEQFQSFKDEPLTACPCGREGTVRRVLQPVGVVFKGSGWYITDSRKQENVTQKPAETKPDAAKTAEPATSDTAAPAPDASSANAPASENRATPASPAS